MRKRVVALAVVALLGAVCSSAEPTCGGQADLSWLLPAPANEVVTAALPMTTELSAKEGSLRTVTCTADCQNGTSVSCTAATCSAVQRDCSAAERGHVTCNGVSTYCPVCPANCTVFQCRQPCKQPGCVASCLSTVTCECETICF